MQYKNILITGGAGFIGSTIACLLKKNYADINVVALDNLKRRGSELNLVNLYRSGVRFMHGDIRHLEDLPFDQNFDLIIEAAAEPSVLAGFTSPVKYLVDTNLLGTVNILELAKKTKAHVIFLSTSRVYPLKELGQLSFTETETRFSLNEKQSFAGVSQNGINENFVLGKTRSFYGATKLCSEHLIAEYGEAYGVPYIINRCGVVTGPGQMAKADQGVLAFWMAGHIFQNNSLKYIGYGGNGKQVRDFIHSHDLFEALRIQWENFEKYQGETFNIGGGTENSVSLKELTVLCGEISGKKVDIQSVMENRPNDIPIYISDCSKFKKLSGWKTTLNARETLSDIHDWMIESKDLLRFVLENS